MLYSINKEQRLYVLKFDYGFSCVGFDVAERKRQAVAKWLGVSAPSMRLGTKKHWQACQDMLDRASAHCEANETRCPVELTPQLVGLEGKRVEVIEADGSKRRFYVGKSTGWMPIHLEIKTRRSTGGVGVYLPEGATVRVVRS